MLGPHDFCARGYSAGKEWLDPKGIVVTCLTAAGSCRGALQWSTPPAANALLILAIAPFLAALLSWLDLRETIDGATMVAIALVFMGVLINRIGKLWAGQTARRCICPDERGHDSGLLVYASDGRPSQYASFSRVGLNFGGLLALPVADFTPVSGTQALLIFLSGAVILPGAAGLLMLGPRYLPAPEVSMITLLEVILGPCRSGS